jgi:hypothetical protein
MEGVRGSNPLSSTARQKADCDYAIGRCRFWCSSKVQQRDVTAILLCRRICIATRGWTSRRPARPLAPPSRRLGCAPAPAAKRRSAGARPRPLPPGRYDVQVVRPRSSSATRTWTLTGSRSVIVRGGQNPSRSYVLASLRALHLDRNRPTGAEFAGDRATQNRAARNDFLHISLVRCGQFVAY